VLFAVAVVSAHASSFHGQQASEERQIKSFTVLQEEHFHLIVDDFFGIPPVFQSNSKP
jgi:hypothetical protein